MSKLRIDIPVSRATSEYVHRLKQIFHFSVCLATSLFGSVWLVERRNDNSRQFALKLFQQQGGGNNKDRSRNAKEEFVLEVERHVKLQSILNATVTPAVNTTPTGRVLKHYPHSDASDSKQQQQAPQKQSTMIVQLIESSFEDEFSAGYILTEYIGGGDLVKLVRNAEKNIIPPKEAFFIINAMIEIVSRFHSLGIAHGDISCENFVCERKNGQIVSLRLIDYSTVTFAAESFNEQAHRFKVLYSPPELIKFQPEKVDPMAKDMHALGVCIFILWSGRYPFNRKSYYSPYEKFADEAPLKVKSEMLEWHEIYKHLIDPNVPDPANCRKLPVILKPLLAKIMHPQPEYRFDASRMHSYWTKCCSEVDFNLLQ